MKLDAKRIWIPKLGWVRSAFARSASARSRRSPQGGGGFVSLAVELEQMPRRCESQAAVGVDLGINRLATLFMLSTLSGVEKIEGPKPLRRELNGPAALRRAAAVGAIGGPSKHGSLNITECLQPRETSPVEVALQGLNFVSRTCHPEREADAFQEGTGECTGRSRRGTGPSAYARIMEITSGSTVFQQEARSNLQRFAVYAKAKPARGFRWGA